MPIPSSGPLALSAIQTEFGGSNPISLAEYYAGGAYTPPGTSGTNGAVPTSGTIAMSKFYGTQSIIARAIIMGGWSVDMLRLDHLLLATLGNATAFGNFSPTQGPAFGMCFASTTRFIGSRGYDIRYTTFAATGTFAAFGTFTGLDENNDSSAAISSATRGVYAGGNDDDDNTMRIMHYITIATPGNAIFFGDLIYYRYLLAGAMSPTRGLICAGRVDEDPGFMEYITIATLGNGTTFGNLTANKWGLAGGGSSTRALWSGGFAGTGPSLSVGIHYSTIATLGNATSFGNLTQARTYTGGASSAVRNVVVGGDNTGSGGSSNVIDYVTIATTGNAASFGILTQGFQGSSAQSNNHGGLAA